MRQGVNAGYKFNAQSLNGNMIDINGRPVDPCLFTATPCDPGNAPVRVGVAGKPDIVPLGALLAAAGVQSLDDASDALDLPRNKSAASGDLRASQSKKEPLHSGRAARKRGKQTQEMSASSGSRAKAAVTKKVAIRKATTTVRKERTAARAILQATASKVSAKLLHR